MWTQAPTHHWMQSNDGEPIDDDSPDDDHLVFNPRDLRDVSRTQDLLMDEHDLPYRPSLSYRKPGGMEQLTEFFRNLFGLSENSLH